MNSPVIDIFIKTYPKDHLFLEFTIPSIEKFVQGYRNIIIISDDITDLNIKSLYPDRIKIIEEKLPDIEKSEYKESWWMISSLGYLWQQVVKCNWDKYSDADYVFIIDSECPVNDIFNLQSETFYEGKPIWFYCSWKDAGGAVIWKKCIDDLFNIDSKYETMNVPGFLVSRKLILELREYIKCNKNMSLEQYFLSSKFPVSEYNLMGNFAMNFMSKDAYYMASPEDTNVKRWSKIQLFRTEEKENSKRYYDEIKTFWNCILSKNS
jgi:hypothetical protein